MVKIWNDEFVAALKELETINKNKGKSFNAVAYKKAADTLLNSKENITDVEQIKQYKGIGSSIYLKLKSLVETGKIDIIEKEKGNIIHQLCKIYGVGPKKADELSKSINSIDELKKKPELLNDKQKIGLKYYDDILLRIPREEIEKYKEIIEKTAKSISNKLKAEIVGSYRRGARSSGDIDIILTSENSSDFDKFLDTMNDTKIIVETLSRGKSKSLAIGKIGNNPARRVDFLYTPPKEYPFAILYFTGSAAFNTVMRSRAVELGYSLNEHEMQKAPKDIEFNSEEDIFKFLGLEYKAPTERKSGVDVVLIGKEAKILKNIIKTQKEIPNKLMKSETNYDPQYIAHDVETAKHVKKDKYACFGKEKGKNLEGTKESRQLECSEIQKRADCKENTKCIWKKPVVSEEKLVEDKTESVSEGKLVKTVKVSRKKLKRKTSEFPKNYKDMSLNDIVTLIRKASEKYYNQQPIMSDSEFDELRDHIELIAPEHEVLKEVGAPIDKTKEKINLPYMMPSMNKVKPDTLEKWLKNYTGPYCISAKLDGVSGLLVQKNGVKKLYTRGNGKVGQDISNLIPYIKAFGDDKLTKEDFVVRGELIIPEKIFQENFKNKPGKKASNSRNTASGLIVSKTINTDDMKYLNFVLYEVIEPSLKPSDQFKYAATQGFEVVRNEYVQKVDLNYASNTLKEWRKTGNYTIDGIIICSDEIYPRLGTTNPKHAVAFKMVLEDQTAETVVTKVVWTTSKNNLKKPTVHFNKIWIGDVKIQKVNGQNASFIVNNSIGPGARIQITRRGDVIPYIEKVIIPAKEPQMPTGKYEWNSTGVDIVVEVDAEAQVALALAFFKGLEVDGIGPGTLKKFNEAGYATIPDILAMSKEDILEIDGFKETSAVKIYNGIQKLVENNFSNVPLSHLMGLSGTLGRNMGRRKNEEVLKMYPDILIKDVSDEELIELLRLVPSFSTKSAVQFAQGLPKFKQFADNVGFKYKYAPVDKESPPVNITGSLSNKSFVITGGKTSPEVKNIIEIIKKKGGRIGSSVSGKTTAVITNDANSDSDKIQKAVKLGIPVYTYDVFLDLYNN
tara:strand:+ start:7624 stop:10836 length:3213 start_codon:yes stop_codon:yes gene_type:complete